MLFICAINKYGDKHYYFQQLVDKIIMLLNIKMLDIRTLAHQVCLPYAIL